MQLVNNPEPTTFLNMQYKKGPYKNGSNYNQCNFHIPYAQTS